jgi:predicted nucleotidyltransferase
MKYGLREEDIESIKKEFKKFSEIEKVILFGSRARGNYKKGSDIDLVLLGERLNNEILFKLNMKLNQETVLPYFFDIILYNDIRNKNLIKHIDEIGEIIYINKI